MSVCVTSYRDGQFVVDSYPEGDEMWMVRHPLDKNENRLVIQFDKDISELLEDDETIILSPTPDGRIEVLFVVGGNPARGRCVNPNQVYETILALT